MARRRRLVAIGFARPATGLERVMRRVLAALAVDFEVHWLGLGYRGDVKPGTVTLHPSNLEGGDVLGVQGGRDLVDRLGADVVLLYNDLWMLQQYRRLFDRARPERIVAYCPLDGRITDPALVDMVDWVDDVVVYSEFARRQLPGARVIGHGVDERPFAPLDRAECRAAMLPAEAGWQEGFVVLNANRLQPRKRIDITIEGFAAFAAERPKARLYLHLALTGLAEERLVPEWLAASGLGDRVHVSREVLSDEQLNLLYNACDVGVNTAMGEGWGLVSFEHALTGAAQVVPRHSACEELWEGAAQLVNPVTAEVPPFAPLEMRAVAPGDVASALAQLHDRPQRLEAMSASARGRATERRFTWEAVGSQWRDLLNG